MIVSRGLMELRIARKVAALGGIAGPADSTDDAGRGRAWLSDYRMLTTTELSIGGPVRQSSDADDRCDGGVFDRDGRRFRHVDGDVDFMPIPNVTLRDYGPDTKAALVLTGVNKVLERVAEAVTDALADIRTQVDAPILLVAVGQCLLQEVFAAQPILLLHGIQASLIQRALMLPEPIVRHFADVRRPLARVEYGSERSRHIHAPRNLTIVYELWNSVVAGTDLDGRGTLHGTEPYLRAKPLCGYEQQNEQVAFTGNPELRERLVSQLRDASESSLTGKVPGAPRSCVLVVDSAAGQPSFEVTIPRQRQIELMLADVAPRLAPRLLDKPLQPGQDLALPRIDSELWRGKGLLHRRAALLAHYYSLRVAGLISGMTKFDHRLNRDECAQRCAALVDACAELLSADDPLQDQISAYALAYQQQYDASYGRDSYCYRPLASALNRMAQRVDRGETGRARLVEIMPLVLDDLGSTRYAVTVGVSGELSSEEITADLDRWWQVTRKLSRELVGDEQERSFVDLGYAGFLLDDSSADTAILRGLSLVTEVIDSRERSARKEGRWTTVRLGYMVYLRGLRIALQRRIVEERIPGWAAKAYEVTTKLSDHEETWRFLDQRTDARRPGGVIYDIAALLLLVSLADGWVWAVRSGALDPGRHEKAATRADQAVRRLETYLEAVQAGSHHSVSRLDPFRATIAARVISQWHECDQGPVQPAGLSHRSCSLRSDGDDDLAE